MAVCCARAGAPGPRGVDGVAMPGEWSNDELSSEGDRDPAAELRDLEDELCRLSGVHAVRVVGDRSGRPIEVHVLADPSKPAKQTDRELTGYAEGSVATAARPQLVAAAALDAVRQGEPAAEAIHIASAEISRIGSTRVAIVTVVYVDPPAELVVSGSAVVRRDRDDAVARALLDATNRRLARAERGHAPG